MIELRSQLAYEDRTAFSYSLGFHDRPTMSCVEELYQAAIDRMTPAEKVARCQEMFNWSREFIGRQVRSEFPNASIQRVKLLVALRMYGSEPSMKELLEGLLADVPD